MGHRGTQEGRTARAVAIDRTRVLIVGVVVLLVLAALCLLPSVALGAAPVIDSVSPPAAPVGEVITISGSGFGTGARRDVVVFTRDNGNTVNGSVVSWADTLIEVEVPNHADAGPLTVVVGGVSSNAVEFVPADMGTAAEPFIESLSTDHAPPGATITVYGSGFEQADPGSRVEFWKDGGEVSGQIVSWTDTQIEVIVPSKAIQGFVRVWVRELWASNPVYFVPADLPQGGNPPVIDSLSTYAAPPGSIITVYGSYFGDSQGTSDVVFRRADDTLRAATVVSWSDTAIEVEVPRWAVADYMGVIVDEYWTSNGMYFVPYALPVVDTASPTEASPGDPVTITGSGFGNTQGGGWVTFQGVAGDVVSWSDTQIEVLVPDGATTGYVGVVQNGLVSNGIFFEPHTGPAIASLSVSYALVGDVVTVTGSGFGDTPDLLALAGEPVSPLSWSDTEITFEVPAAAQMGYVGVWRDGVCSNGAFFSPGARIDSLSSWWGPEGSEITINGAGFGASVADVRATIDGVAVPIVTWSETEIVVSVPAGAPSGYVGVWRDWVCSNGVPFLVIDQAIISGVSTTTVTPGQEIVINGTDFGPQEPQSAVMIGGVFICETVSWSDTEIVARVPLDAQSGYVGVWKQGVASNGLWVEVMSP